MRPALSAQPADRFSWIWMSERMHDMRNTREFRNLSSFLPHHSSTLLGISNGRDRKAIVNAEIAIYNYSNILLNSWTNRKEGYHEHYQNRIKDSLKRSRNLADPSRPPSPPTFSWISIFAFSCLKMQQASVYTSIVSHYKAPFISKLNR